MGALPWPGSCAHAAIPGGYGRGTSQTARRRHAVACSPRLFRTRMLLESDAPAKFAHAAGESPCRFGQNVLAVVAEPPRATTTSRFEPAVRAGTLRGAVAEVHHNVGPKQRGRRRRKRPGTRVFVGLCMKMAEMTHISSSRTASRVGRLYVPWCGESVVVFWRAPGAMSMRGRRRHFRTCPLMSARPT